MNRSSLLPSNTMYTPQQLFDNIRLLVLFYQSIKRVLFVMEIDRIPEGPGTFAPGPSEPAFIPYNTALSLFLRPGYYLISAAVSPSSLTLRTSPMPRLYLTKVVDP